MPEQESFGRWLKARRKTRDLTQQALADQVGCSIDMVKKVEAGTARPSRQLAELLVAALGVAPGDRPPLVQWARDGRGQDHSADPAGPSAAARPPGPTAAPPPTSVAVPALPNTLVQLGAIESVV